MNREAVAVPLSAVPPPLVSPPLPMPPPLLPATVLSPVPPANAPPQPVAPPPLFASEPHTSRQEADKPAPPVLLPVESPPQTGLKGISAVSPPGQKDVVEEKSTVAEQFAFAVYPPSCDNPQTKHVASFGKVRFPSVFAAPVCVPVTEIVSALPQQLPPPYVVFGGARYEQLPFAKKAHRYVDPSRNCQRATAMKRASLDYMTGQLKLAREYLDLGTLPVPPDAPKGGEPLSSGVITPATALSFEDGAFSQKNIWTVAYTGSAKELHSFIESFDVDALNANGFVLYNRRQYGIKRLGEKFVLGLGKKASPLQFAAVAGHLDNVVLLLHYGAMDNSSPRLKDIVGADVMKMIRGLRVGLRSRRAAPSSKAEVEDGVLVTNAPLSLTAEEVVPPMGME
ncbi:hypothetical protein MOQ_006112 [Trypanosoma cruzi marinkellei]|uniref:Uncharacterized protein n=1 Tax=Trypanosoma cruzi marinkellei TaxID=85056 RepID=K2NMK5_TRYCR|nr:hypothetical protein MOQ_006112 [Trypanosoma cruzi marinkellei]